MTRNILLLGSGFVSEPVLAYFSRFPNFHVTIATNDQNSGNFLHSKYKPSSSLTICDVTKKNLISPLIKTHDVVISLLPAPLHPLIGQYCLEASKHMVTSSYISPELKAMNEQVKAKNLTFLNEMGFDPGVDHIVTLKVRDDIKALKGKIESFESHCGALLSPEYLDNPFNYKFTWSPAGVFRAISDARFLKNNKIEEVSKRELMYNVKELNVSNKLKLEYYPNRDSLIYKQLYGLDDAQRVIRGTVRFPGFTEVTAGLMELGLFNQDGETGSSWVDFIERNIKLESDVLSIFPDAAIEQLRLKFPEIAKNFSFTKLLNTISHHSLWYSLSLPAQIARATNILSAISFMNLWNVPVENPNASPFNNTISVLSKIMTCPRDNKDLIVLYLVFTVKFETGARQVWEYNCIMAGDNPEAGGLSAIEKGVGLTTAVGAKMVLDGVIKQRGVIGPFTREVYEPVYRELKELGLIKSIEIKPEGPFL